MGTEENTVPTTGDDGKNENTKTDEQKPAAKEFKPITSQEEFDDLLHSRLERAKRSAIADAEKDIEARIRADIEAKAQEEADKAKGEYEKLYNDAQAKIADLEKKLADRDLLDLKVKVLEDHKLPASAAKRISGTTKEEIESDIKDYLKDLPTVTAPKEPGVTSPTKTVGSKVKTSSGLEVEDPATWGFPSLKK